MEKKYYTRLYILDKSGKPLKIKFIYKKGILKIKCITKK